MRVYLYQMFAGEYVTAAYSSMENAVQGHAQLCADLGETPAPFINKCGNFWHAQQGAEIATITILDLDPAHPQ